MQFGWHSGGHAPWGSRVTVQLKSCGIFMGTASMSTRQSRYPVSRHPGPAMTWPLAAQATRSARCRNSWIWLQLFILPSQGWPLTGFTAQGQRMRCGNSSPFSDFPRPAWWILPHGIGYPISMWGLPGLRSWRSRDNRQMGIRPLMPGGLMLFLGPACGPACSKKLLDWNKKI